LVSVTQCKVLHLDVSFRSPLVIEIERQHIYALDVIEVLPETLQPARGANVHEGRRLTDALEGSHHFPAAPPHGNAICQGMKHRLHVKNKGPIGVPKQPLHNLLPHDVSRSCVRRETPAFPSCTWQAPREC